MPRPCKVRRICAVPGCDRFAPAGTAARGHMAMTLDEFEAIRLIDLEGMTQEQCARSMDIARSTVQMIYNSARYKLAKSLVNALELHIGGGDCVLCGGGCEHCRKKHCTGRRCGE